MRVHECEREIRLLVNNISVPFMGGDAAILEKAEKKLYRAGVRGAVLHIS